MQAALRGLGLTIRAAAVPGTGRSAGYYTDTPKGVTLRGLPVRDRLVGQKKLSVTADRYTHVLSDGREADYAELLAPLADAGAAV